MYYKRQDAGHDDLSDSCPRCDYISAHASPVSRRSA
jgi:hypothetical protein